MKFVDEAEIFARAGHGGPGAVSWRREKFTPRGGPDGGDGGRGGDIVFKVNPQLSTLLDLRYKKNYLASNGEAGGAAHCHGRDGESFIIQVPQGTRILNEQGELIRDLSEANEVFVCFKGGKGGKGNSFFKSSVNQAPAYAQPGLPGEEGQLRIELKLIADIGVIGYPNAGKSTLISKISAARPKIADYPFTTLIPNLGVVKVGDGSVVVADIPGLIPGAHKGQGLGIRFLKHIERTTGFVHLIDASEFSGREPLQDFEDINLELQMYDREFGHQNDYVPLSSRKQLVVLNKIDSTSEGRVNEIKSQFEQRGLEVRLISAVCGHGLKELIFDIGRLALENKKEAIEQITER